MITVTHTSRPKIDGKTNMGSREATNAEHAAQTAEGYYVARLKGGTQLHLRKMGEGAICGAAPGGKGGFKFMKTRAGWETYKPDSRLRASCVKCLDGFVPRDTSLDAVIARCIK